MTRLQHLAFAIAAGVATSVPGIATAQDTDYSYGGNLREGPGDEYAVVGSLPEGSWVVMQATGVWSGGYQWFWVDTDYGSAFHWGGLMCSLDYYVDGALDMC